jgi:hypothetical protein
MSNGYTTSPFDDSLAIKHNCYLTLPMTRFSTIIQAQYEYYSLLMMMMVLFKMSPEENTIA